MKAIQTSSPSADSRAPADLPKAAPTFFDGKAYAVFDNLRFLSRDDVRDKTLPLRPFLVLNRFVRDEEQARAVAGATQFFGPVSWLTETNEEHGELGDTLHRVGSGYMGHLVPFVYLANNNYAADIHACRTFIDTKEIKNQQEPVVLPDPIEDIKHGDFGSPDPFHRLRQLESELNQGHTLRDLSEFKTCVLECRLSVHERLISILSFYRQQALDHDHVNMGGHCYDAEEIQAMIYGLNDSRKYEASRLTSDEWSALCWAVAFEPTTRIQTGETGLPWSFVFGAALDATTPRYVSPEHIYKEPAKVPAPEESQRIKNKELCSSLDRAIKARGLAPDHQPTYRKVKETKKELIEAVDVPSLKMTIVGVTSPDNPWGSK